MKQLYQNLTLIFPALQIKKPLIERKRRERINNCLAQLKTILLENIKQNVSFRFMNLIIFKLLAIANKLNEIELENLSIYLSIYLIW